jgi:hypothetical protein
VSLRMLSDVLKNKDINTYCPLCGRKFGRVEASEEHIFPRWLQHHHSLWTKRLTIPNFIGKAYKSVKIDICTLCNNKRYGKLETRISGLFRSPDPFAATGDASDDELAIWLGKIFWLLCRKSHSVEDFRTRNDPTPDRILPNEMMPGTTYLGTMQRAFSTKKGMASCYVSDPPFPGIYEKPYSLYRFRIDPRDSRFEAFDFIDNISVMGAAIRSNNIGIVCVYDGGLHRRFRAHHYDFLANQSLHPVQFNEVVGKIFFDQTVLDSRANEITYFWNKTLHSVIAMMQTPRSYDPYLEENNDRERYAYMIGRLTYSDPSKMFSADGRVFSSLTDQNGAFLRYAVTDEEIEAARNDPHRKVREPLDAAWRNKPPSE